VKLAGLAFVLCAALTCAPVVAAQDVDNWNDVIGPGRRPSAEPEQLERSIARLEAAIAAEDAAELREALAEARAFGNVEFLPVLERVIALPPWPSDVAAAEDFVAGQHPDRLADQMSGALLSAEEHAARVGAFDEWKPYGLVVAVEMATGDRVGPAIGDLATRTDDSAHDALIRCLDDPSIAANPAKASRLIAALASRSGDDTKIHERLRATLLAVDELDAQLLHFTARPPYATSPDRHIYLHALPAEAVARSVAGRLEIAPAMLTAVADGLMLGAKHFGDDPEATFERTRSNPNLAVSCKIGKLCAESLGSRYDETFRWADPVSRDRALDRIRREALEGPNKARAVAREKEARIEAAAASLRSAIERRDGPALEAALTVAFGLDSTSLFDSIEEAAALPVLPDARELALARVDELIRETIDGLLGTANGGRAASGASERMRLENACRAWRPFGIEVMELQISARHTQRICEYLSERGDDASFESLTRILTATDVRSNPVARAEVIRALARFGHTSKVVDDELCKLINSAERIESRFMRLVPAPPVSSSPTSLPIGLEPIIEAVRYYEVRRTKRRKVVATLIDGLMFGYDTQGESAERELKCTVGRACSDALFACTRRHFVAYSPKAHADAEAWLKRAGKIFD
jgi:hypothetical protein